MDYTQMPLAQQSQLILREYCNDAVLRQRAKMWSAAATELPQVSKDFLNATHKAKDAEWDKDDVGTQFLATSAQTQRVIDDWEQRVTAAKPAEALERVAALIKPTYEKVQQAVEGYNNEVRAAAETGANAEQIRAIELKWRRVAGAAMNTLGKAASDSAQTMQQLVGAPDWRGVSDATPGTDTNPTNTNTRTGTGPASPTAETGPQDLAPNMEKSTAPLQQNPQTTPTGTPTGSPTGSPTGGSPTGGSPTGGGPAGSSDPQLSGGLGSAPQIPTPTVPQLPGAGTPTIPGGGAPLIPPMIPPTGAASGLGIPGGGRPIGGGGGGLRVPGVSLGGGGGAGGTIPVAGAASATPVNQMPTPTGPAASALGAAGGTSGAGSAMPPMMPPMGAAGAGAGLGGGGTPGSGAAKRAAPGRGRARDGRTPGLVGPLSGKAGKADPNAFAARNRRAAEESDIPSTVQLIDEDLWQVEQRTPATRH